MKLIDLEKYCFHDSSIIELVKENNNIKLKIEYCLFMQDDYIDGTPENCILNLTFKDAISNIDSISDNTIINTIISDNSITFNLDLDESNDFIQLVINANSVEISKN